MIGNDDFSRTHDKGWWHMTFNEHCKCHKIEWNWLKGLIILTSIDIVDAIKFIE